MYACMEAEGDGTPDPGCLTPLGLAPSLRARAKGPRLPPSGNFEGLFDQHDRDVALNRVEDLAILAQ